MPSSLPQFVFDFLQVFNGPWSPLVTDPRGGNGTINNDDILITNLVSGLVVSGGDGNDRITIQSGLLNIANITDGGNGSDQIFGSSGINTINGGAGNDWIDGGNGIDVLTGGDGQDTVSFESLSQAVTLTLNASGGGVATSGLHGDTLTGGFENVVGTKYNDTITGNASSNRLFGYDGNDVIRGGAGIDTILGGANDDTLYGDNGDDRLDGQAGYDWLAGNSGRDTYVFAAVSDSSDVNPNRSDHILGLNVDGVKDVIDVSQIDADLTQPGQQHFTLVDDGNVLGGQIGYQPFGTSYGHQIFGNVIGSDEDLRIILQSPLISGSNPIDFIL